VAILARWRYCPRCADELTHLGSRVECPACGFVRWANPLPAVAALVVDAEGRLLLGRRAFEPDVGMWDTIGGFLEEDEDALTALHREVLEETGLEVRVGEFVGALSDRYGDGDDVPIVLNLVFEARLVAGDPQPADDVTELAWFAPDALPADGELAFNWIAHALREWAARRSDRL
jgi:ADP-ribose pyrophosphatase YjhB (NUDIX family)